MKTQSDSHLINLKNRSGGYARQPLLVAHRGGVITTGSPENSLRAIQLAGKQAYDMVELDVVSSKEGTPVLFHGPEGHLGRDCGVDAFVHQLSAAELTNIQYLESDQSILTLSKALETCFELKLGVMLDIKNHGRPYKKEFFIQIADLFVKYRLSEASLTFTQDPLALKYLGAVLMTAISDDELKNFELIKQISFRGRWWFPLPNKATSHLVTTLQQCGALVIAAINRFRYPAHAHKILAKKDLQRLVELGVDGFQIDSLYYDLVSL